MDNIKQKCLKCSSTLRRYQISLTEALHLCPNTKCNSELITQQIVQNTHIQTKRSQKIQSPENVEKILNNITSSHEHEIRELESLIAPYYTVEQSISLASNDISTTQPPNPFDDLLDFSMLDILNDDLTQYDLNANQTIPYETSFMSLPSYTLAEPSQSTIVIDSSQNMSCYSGASHIEITKINEADCFETPFKDNHVTILKGDGEQVEDEENEELLDWERKKTRHRAVGSSVKQSDVKLKPQTPIGKSMLSAKAKQKDSLKERGALLKNALIEESLNKSGAASPSSAASGLFPCGYKDLVMSVLRKKKNTA